MRDHHSLSTLHFKDWIVKKFFIKVFIMFVLPTVLLIGTAIIFPILPENAYDLSIIDKHRILADAKSPKIALAGGSNLAFGIDSSAIQDRFSVPVVNMGVHAGFGLGRILEDISRFLHTGDVLLVIPEYSHFTSAWNGSGAAFELIFDARQYRLLWSTYYGLPSGFSDQLSMRLDINIRTVRDSAKNGVEKIIKQNENEQDKEETTANPLAYSRDGFNEYGDYVKHLAVENQPFVSFENAGIINTAYLKKFFRLVDNFTKRGITVMLSYPCYEEQSFRNSAALIQELNMLFRAKENLLVISTPESYCYPAEYFYDTSYHLNREGRAVRTGQLIRDLQESGLLSQSP
jgi:hypothetical protein